MHQLGPLPAVHFWAIYMVWTLILLNRSKSSDVVKLKQPPPSRLPVLPSLLKKRHHLLYDNFDFLQISKALAGADRKDLMRKLPKFIYDEEKALEVRTLVGSFSSSYQ